MRCKNDMAVIAANGRVFFIIIFTVGCIGVKTVSGYPESSKDESDISTLGDGAQVWSTVTEPNFPLPPSLEEMAKKRDELLRAAKKVRRQYTTAMPRFLTSAKKKKKRTKMLHTRKCRWRRAFRQFWKWHIMSQRRKRRRKKTKQRGTGRRRPEGIRKKTSEHQNAEGDWIQRNRLLLKQTLQKLGSYSNVK